MEYGMGPELEAFRAEVRAFIADHAPPIPPRAGVRSAENEAELKSLQDWTARLFEAGYVGVDWPADLAYPQLIRSLHPGRSRRSSGNPARSQAIWAAHARSNSASAPGSGASFSRAASARWPARWSRRRRRSA